MAEVSLTYPTPEGSREIRIEEGRISFGRGGDADYRFEDDGLSRLHATVYREGDRVWIVDENSSNGTFVNGAPADPVGTPLRNGDQVRIGNQTVLNVRIAETAVRVTSAAAPSVGVSTSASASPASATPFNIIPVALIAVAFFVISISAVLIGYKVLGGNSAASATNEDEYDTTETDRKNNDDDVPKAKTSATPKPSDTGRIAMTDSTLPAETPATTIQPPTKKYSEMSDLEKRKFIEEKSMRIAQIIGNNSSDAIPSAAVDKIKVFADAYAKRAGVKPLGGCRFGDNLQSTYERASKNAPFIVRAFNEKGIDPRIGLYLAMIESEHCVCLQSPTGPLGMFQFTRATAELHGLKVFKGASPTNPDERCEPEPAARAAASYMKALTGRYGTGPASVPLAIGSYNSGEGGLSSNLTKALESNSGLPRDFWSLISKGEILSKQFQSENFKYVPKFFAAAIIGENPQDFGLKLQPLSTYSK